jgi:hypothetical protein
MRGTFRRPARLYCVAVAAVLAASLAGTHVARADGTLPPQPYNYLHPPASLKGENNAPTSADKTIQASGGFSRAGFVFTPDTQAGIVAPAGAFATLPTATAVRVQIRPVETPSGLPHNLVGEGNAYTISAEGEPGNTAVRLVRKVTLTLRWPHIPLAIYSYAGGTWSQLCYSDQATFTPSTMACPIKTLGLYTAVNNPAFAGIHTPTTPAPSSRFAWLNRYIPLIAALAVLLFTTIFAFLAIRPDRRRRSS